MLPQPLIGRKIFFVGIKGTGMAALAELFHKMGAIITGSDTEEVFYTDSVLRQLGIKYREGFSASNLDEDYDLVIHSSAYNSETNPDLAEALRRNIPVLEYTQALGAYSRSTSSCGISGVHGKTTTTGITGTILKEMRLPVSVLAGSAISNFDGKSTFVSGTNYFVAETCEYKRHFLSFSPDILVVTSIEPDHLDYFRDYNDIFSAFSSYAEKVPPGGILIYCQDDPGAASLGKLMSERGNDIKLVPYGFRADGMFRIGSLKQLDGKTLFSLDGFNEEFEIKIPGKHNVLNSAAALAASAFIASRLSGKSLEDVVRAEGRVMADGIRSFRGSKRRSELLGTADGIVFMDDYAHHPTAIATTLAGLRSFYPGKRIIVDFMSHTYSRTKSLMNEFSSAFGDADIVILNRIYASAREKADAAGTAGLDDEFFRKTREKHGNVLYYREPAEAASYLKKELKEGDLFITMGAGDNWKLGAELYSYYRQTDRRR